MKNKSFRWLGIGIAVGVSVGVALGNIAIGAGVGVVLGVALANRENKKSVAEPEKAESSNGEN